MALSEGEKDAQKWCWLCGAKWQLRLDWPLCSIPKWWGTNVEAQWFLYRFRSVPDGLSRTSSQERWKTQAASSWLAHGITPNIAGARYVRHDSSTLLYLCSNRSLCRMVRCPRITVLYGRPCNAGSDTDRRYNSQGAFAQYATNCWTLDTGQWI